MSRLIAEATEGQAKKEAGRVRQAAEQAEQQRERALKCILEDNYYGLGKHEDLDPEITFIDRRTVERPVRKTQQFGGDYVRWWKETVLRFSLDGEAVVWVFPGAGGESFVIAPEVGCSRCGKRAPMSWCKPATYGAHGLVEQIGVALSGREFTCPWCQVEMPRECSCCGRRSGI